MEYTTTNAFFLRDILQIGGIESHFWYLARKYGQYDIAIICYRGDAEQVKRLRQYVRVIIAKKDDRIVCENMFCCFNREILDQTEAKHIYIVLHGDYLDMVKRKQLSKDYIPLDDRAEKYLAVSKTVADSWEKLTGIKAYVVGEPIDVPPAGRPILLCSATRLSPEKGWGRMIQLANALNENGVNFLWVIFTNSPKNNAVANMVFLPPRLDVADKLPLFDAYVQLSDNEGFCLSVVEALLRGVPVIGTDLPVFHEIGLNEANSVLLGHDMQNIPVEKIASIYSLKGFDYTAPKDRWLKYISKAKSTYNPQKNLVEATGEWKALQITDVQLGFIPSEGYRWRVDDERLKYIRDYEERFERTMVKVIEENNT